MPFDIATARTHFPSLSHPGTPILLDGAGGSQTLDTVITSISTYLLTSNVQLYSSYPTSIHATTQFHNGITSAATFLNALPTEIVTGASAHQLLQNLSTSLRFPPGSELIISQLDHEANIAPWLRLASAQNLTIKWWRPENLILSAETLKPLLSEKTAWVTCTHTSNILGTVVDVAGIADAVHSVGAMLCVDGVGHAPHRRVDVKALGVDAYVFSWYKVFGPHISTLYVSETAQKHITPFNHFFNPGDTLHQKLSVAASNYELTACLPAILDYLGPDLNASWEAIEAHEGRLQKVLLDYLCSRDDVTIYGERTADTRVRVPIVSFTVRGRKSQDVVEGIEADEEGRRYALRWGNCYSYRLVAQVLGLGEDGVVRVSMLHYNTVEEIEGLVEIFKRLL